jgi:transcriptional regulator with XRE-family HTH domain
MNIKELRAKKKLTQEGLSVATGIPRARIAKWEAGKSVPKAQDLKTLENYFTNALDEPAEEYKTKNGYLEESVRNLTETEKINAKNIERLISLLEIQVNSNRNPKPTTQDEELPQRVWQQGKPEHRVPDRLKKGAQKNKSH